MESCCLDLSAALLLTSIACTLQRLPRASDEDQDPPASRTAPRPAQQG